VTAAIEARDLFRIHATADGNAAALQGLSLTVREREVLVILGPSGSGKSTLLRILAGLDRPSAGVVRSFGTDLTGLSGRALAAYRSRTTGYADQHYSRALAPELTARELVGLRLGLEGKPRAERLRRADELLEQVGLFDRRGTRPHELSGGEQQRVAVCASVAHRPRLLLCDEPTGELDHANAQLLYEALGGLARAQGCTTIVVSHDPESASVADRIVQIRDGRLSAEWAREAGGDEAIVVGKGGWLRVPEELLRRAGVARRATARMEGAEIVIAPAERVADVLEASPARAAEGAPEAIAGVSGLVKRFGRGRSASRVFEGLDASFRTGRLAAVTGPSGSGKTTLLRVLAGLELPDAGQVLVAGTRVDTLDRARRAAFRRASVGVVMQDPALVPFLSARENVELGLSLRGIPAPERAVRAAEALAAVGLAELVKRRADELSAGERERVAIARALAARPTVLLADEPTARLDEANARSIARLLGELARETGAAVVCATHDRCVVEQADEELALDGAASQPVAA
jgi:ABC-type lipoprotein export system ATPase subunit